MSDRLILRLFFTCLFTCAAMVLFRLWTGDFLQGPIYFQTAASLFIIGLASFLTWFVRTLRRIALTHESP